MSSNIVIGAGPAGLGVALGLENDCTVLEASRDIGGLSNSFEIQGAVFDLGGHSFHTAHPEVRDLVFASLDMYEQTRNAKCYIQGQVIPYPFQKYFQEINNEQLVKECSEGLELVSADQNPGDFEAFIKGKFGPGIANHFMLPYNKKLWGRDLTRMTADWTQERVAAPRGSNEKFETSGGKRKPLQADTRIAYPAKGGFGEIFKALGERVKDLRFDHKVSSIDSRKKQVVMQNGDRLSYHQLISTMPLPYLLSLIPDTPAELIEQGQQLDYLSMKLGFVVINHPIDTDIHRFYSSEPEIPAHKIALNHTSSDYLRSLPVHGVIMEISDGPEKDFMRTDFEQWIAESLLQIGVVKSLGEIQHVEIKEIRHAYPVPTHNRTRIVSGIKDWLAENHIYTTGRFGEWSYINSDQALARGLDLGKQLLNS